MKSQARRGRTWLLANARRVAEDLKLHRQGAPLRIRIPRSAFPSDTDGWYATIGDLGKGKPRLEVWFDRYSSNPDRKLYAGLAAGVARQINQLSANVDKRLWPVRTVTYRDTEYGKFLRLGERISRTEFGRPILERNIAGISYFGFYDPTRGSGEKINSPFCARAVGFFSDVLQSLQRAAAGDEHRDVYPRFENRKKVVSHLRRERSSYLAAECKIRDDYICQVCEFRFEDAYGELGQGFAEAHHRIPLSKLRENVKTRVEDLITVCANCHRMLHRMDGCGDDVATLKAVFKRHRTSPAMNRSGT